MKMIRTLGHDSREDKLTENSLSILSLFSLCSHRTREPVRFLDKVCLVPMKQYFFISKREVLPVRQSVDVVINLISSQSSYSLLSCHACHTL